MFKHLEDTNESYFTHMQNSLHISLQLLKGSTFAFIHAFIPDAFPKNASNICRKIIKNVDDRSSSSTS